MYCTYCGRAAHRCTCAAPHSRIRRFLARRSPPAAYTPRLQQSPYIRGVPPQLKKRQRDILRAHYAQWYALLTERDGPRCLNCGREETLVIDHILPVAKGGLSSPENLQLLCSECNTLKHKLTINCRSL